MNEKPLRSCCSLCCSLSLCCALDTSRSRPAFSVSAPVAVSPLPAMAMSLPDCTVTASPLTLLPTTWLTLL